MATSSPTWDIWAATVNISQVSNLPPSVSTGYVPITFSAEFEVKFRNLGKLIGKLVHVPISQMTRLPEHL